MGAGFSQDLGRSLPKDLVARLKKLGWGKGELAARRKSDPEKVALARDLRCQTTMSLKWIARRLEMGSWTHVSNLLRQ